METASAFLRLWLRLLNLSTLVVVVAVVDMQTPAPSLVHFNMSGPPQRSYFYSSGSKRLKRSVTQCTTEEGHAIVPDTSQYASSRDHVSVDNSWCRPGKPGGDFRTEVRLGVIHTGRATRRPRKLECFSIDLAWEQCEHSH